jgi:hypothetical protein
MSNNPERIWVHYEHETDDAQWSEYNYLDGLEDYKHYGEYIRADRIEGLEAKLTKAVEALDEAVYLLGPDEEDTMMKAGVYRVVTRLAELKGQ